jgi:GNAT superfamily N-acetyltransferase
MSQFSVTRRNFLGSVAAVAAPALLPASLFSAPERLRRIDAYWAEFFGCSVQDLHRDKTVVVTHKALERYEGALVFRHAPSCIISVPDTVPEVERAKLRRAPPAEASDPGFLSQVFQVDAEKVRGPAGIGFADRADFTPMASPARLLGDADEAAIRRLADRCGEAVWQHSRLYPSRGSMVGLFQGGDLVAASGYLVIKDLIALVGVVIHPEWRGRGLGRRVVKAAMQDAFDQDLVPAWRTPPSDDRAVALGRSLGFGPYADTVDVPLFQDEL